MTHWLLHEWWMTFRLLSIFRFSAKEACHKTEWGILKCVYTSDSFYKMQGSLLDRNQSFAQFHANILTNQISLLSANAASWLKKENATLYKGVEEAGAAGAAGVACGMKYSQCFGLPPLYRYPRVYTGDPVRDYRAPGSPSFKPKDSWGDGRERVGSGRSLSVYLFIIFCKAAVCEWQCIVVRFCYDF